MIYFIIGTFLTLYLLDRFVLRKNLNEIWIPHCEENEEPLETQHLEEHELTILEDPINPKVFYRNLFALGIFFILLITIPNILFVGLLGMLIFVFINPRRENGRKKPDVSYYFTIVDFKLPFFFTKTLPRKNEPTMMLPLLSTPTPLGFNIREDGSCAMVI